MGIAKPIKWIKEYWPIIFVYLLVIAASIYFTFSVQNALLSAIPLLIPLAIKYKSTIKAVKKYWASIAILLIIFSAFHMRLLDYRWPYLRNIDSYMFYRHMDYIINNNGVFPLHDPLVQAPNGQPLGTEWYPYQYIGAYSYLFFLNLFPGLQLWQYLVYFPAFLAALMAIPMYYIGKIIYDKKAGILAAFFVVFEFSNVSRSLGGDPDSDAIVMLVPLILMALFLLTYKYIVDNKFDKKALIYSVITGVALALWAHTWAGYWYILWIITGMIAIRIFLYAAQTKKFKPTFSKSLGLILLYLILFTILLAATYPAYQTKKINDFLSLMRFQEIKSEEGIEFPNVYVSVAELQPGDLRSTIQRTSPIDFNRSPLTLIISPFFLMIYALIYLAYSYYKKRRHFDTLILLLVWFVGPFLSTIVAVRFSILFSSPIAIGSAIILAKAVNMTMYKEKLED